MGKTAFLFPGQGSQYVGMGTTLAGAYPAARLVFDTADQALGFSLSRICAEGGKGGVTTGGKDELQMTENTQPALLAVSIAAFTVLRENGVRPDYVAGHSLGEYSALVAAGSLRFTDALRLVRKRGRLMQEAVPPGEGAMAALLKLPTGRLDEVLEQAAQGEVVAAANLNAPDQVVISGHVGAVTRAMELARAAGARRAIPLPVSAPFHCPLMQPAQQRLTPDLNALAFDDLDWPLINNWQAREIHTGVEARRGLIEHIPRTVRWEESIRYLAAQGVDRFFEVGAGGVLTGLLRSIDPSLQGIKFGEAGDVEKLDLAAGARR